jgi:hypothetical protein
MECVGPSAFSCSIPFEPFGVINGRILPCAIQRARPVQHLNESQEKPRTRMNERSTTPPGHHQKVSSSFYLFIFLFFDISTSGFLLKENSNFLSAPTASSIRCTNQNVAELLGSATGGKKETSPGRTTHRCDSPHGLDALFYEPEEEEVARPKSGGAAAGPCCFHTVVF